MLCTSKPSVYSFLKVKTTFCGSQMEYKYKSTVCVQIICCENMNCITEICQLPFFKLMWNLKVSQASKHFKANLTRSVMSRR